MYMNVSLGVPSIFRVALNMEGLSELGWYFCQKGEVAILKEKITNNKQFIFYVIFVCECMYEYVCVCVCLCVCVCVSLCNNVFL